MKEIWKQLEEDTNYEISNLGKIRNIKTQIIKSTSFTKKGTYEVCSLKANSYLIHRLVAKYFIDNPENKLQVNHIDGNKQNNYYLNLEWCTTQENTKHAILNELTDAKGVKHGNSKLKESDVIEIRSLDLPLKDIAKKFNISFQHVSDIKLRKKWKHI